MDNFDLRKYLVENKVTTNSRMMNESLEDEGPVSNAFKQAGIKPGDMVTLKVTEGYEEQDHGPMPASKAIRTIESLSKNGQLERQYSFDDLEGDGAVINISLSDSITVDVYKANSSKTVKENEGMSTPDRYSMMVFLSELGIDYKDPLFTGVVESGDLEETIHLLADTAGSGWDSPNPFEGNYTKNDFIEAAKEAQFTQDIIDDILDMDMVKNLERG